MTTTYKNDIISLCKIDQFLFSAITANCSTEQDVVLSPLKAMPQRNMAITKKRKCEDAKNDLVDLEKRRIKLEIAVLEQRLSLDRELHDIKKQLIYTQIERTIASNPTMLFNVED